MTFPEYWDFKEILYAIFRPAFLLLDLFGVMFIALGYYSSNPYGGFFATAGSTFITIGLTLPIALYYQMQHSTESFRILKACNKAGILSVFINRLEDNDNLRNYIRSAVSDTKEIFLLGVAFRTLFDPSHAHTNEMKSALYNPNVSIKLLVLDYESPAAIRRQDIEVGGQTRADIKATINTGLVSTIKTRIDYINEQESEHDIGLSSDDMNDVRNKVNIEVKKYTFDPSLFIMGFDNSMFVEPYHFGRPDDKLVPFASCIGKHVPLLQLARESKGYRFYKEHFTYIWEHSEDITDSVLQKTVEAMGMNN